MMNDKVSLKGNAMLVYVEFKGFEGSVSHTVTVGCGDLNMACELMQEKLDSGHRLFGYARKIVITKNRETVAVVYNVSSAKYNWRKHWFKVVTGGRKYECETVAQIEKILEKIA